MSSTDGPITDRLLTGTDEATIDDKGRILVGKKKRERLGDTFVLSIGQTGCLDAYPEATWKHVISDVLSHESINAGTQDYARFMLADTEEDIKFDQQGRFVVPQRMRSVANLKDKVLLLGVGLKVEIWSKQEYETFRSHPDTYGLERRQSIDKAYRQMKGQS
jgi:MraZ protein